MRLRPPLRSLAALLALSAFSIACGSSEGTPITSGPGPDPGDTEAPQDDLASLVHEPSFEPDYNRLVPQPWVEPATKAQTDEVDVDAGQLVFLKATHPEVLSWAAGRVVVAGPGDGAGKNPFGFARRVIAVRDDGLRIVVDTESVGLEDVVVGDFQQVFDPATARDVDLSKVDLEWAAANLYADFDVVSELARRWRTTSSCSTTTRATRSRSRIRS